MKSPPASSKLMAVVVAWCYVAHSVVAPDARGELRQTFELGIPFEGTVSGVVKGGVEVQVAGVRGFVRSQLDLRHTETQAVTSAKAPVSASPASGKMADR